MNRREFLAVFAAAGVGTAIAGIPSDMPKPAASEFPSGAEFWDVDNDPSEVIDPMLPSLYIGSSGVWAEVGRLSEIELIQSREAHVMCCLDGVARDPLFGLTSAPKVQMDVVHLEAGMERLQSIHSESSKFRVIFPEIHRGADPVWLEFDGYVIDSSLAIGLAHMQCLSLTVLPQGGVTWTQQ